MKKGSHLRKCSICSKPIFWIVPTERILGLQCVEHKNVCDWKYYMLKGKKYNLCVCIDCYNKLKEEEN